MLNDYAARWQYYRALTAIPLRETIPARAIGIMFTSDVATLRKHEPAAADALAEGIECWLEEMSC